MTGFIAIRWGCALAYAVFMSVMLIFVWGNL